MVYNTDVTKTKGLKMEKLFINLKKKVIDETDRQMAMDYMTYYGIDESETAEYADSFVEECYDFNEETGEHEQATPDKLPFATITKDGNFTTYEYNHCKITK